jgi:hypothetical protein
VSAREELLALAARVEALTGPDREVDRCIIAALGTHVLEKRRNDRKEWWYSIDDKNTHFRLDNYGFGYDAVPRYTASLDATMKMVPDAHISGVLYHALQCIQQTRFPNSTFLHRLICEIIASALRARAATVPA